jgi:hypothetical protein
MKKFFRQHLQQTLAGAALLFLCVIAAYSLWCITIISLDVSQATNALLPTSAPAAFDLQGAQKLDLKGMSAQ